MHISPLTPRQLLVVRLLVLALDDDEIALAIGTSKQVIKNLNREIRAKYKAKSRVEVALIATKHLPIDSIDRARIVRAKIKAALG